VPDQIGFGMPSDVVVGHDGVLGGEDDLSIAVGQECPERVVAVSDGVISDFYRLPQQLAVSLSRLVLCCHLGLLVTTNLHHANWTGYVGLRCAKTVRA
jgi:hypothetical protein